jgi:hypothetical protein
MIWVLQYNSIDSSVDFDGIMPRFSDPNHCLSLWRAKKSHFQASVESGMKIVDKKTRLQQKQ